MTHQVLEVPRGTHDYVVPATRNIGYRQPQHMLILMMKAAGLEDIAIAERLNVCRQTVANVRAQKWFRDELNALIVTRGGNVVEDMIRANGADAVAKVVELMNSTEVQPQIQQKSAMFIIDKLVADKLDVTRIQNLPPDVAAREIQVLEAQIAEIKDGKSTTPIPSSTPVTTPGEETPTTGVAESP